MGRMFDGMAMIESGEVMPVRMIVMGDAKVGKTTFAATFPDPFAIFMAMEDGHKTLIGKPIEGYICTSWSDISDQVEKFVAGFARAKAQGKSWFKTFIFDGLSFAGLMLEAELRETTAYKDPRQMWGDFANQMQAHLNTLHTLPINVVYTAHVQTKENDKGQTVSSELLFQGKFRKLLPASVDGCAAMIPTDKPSVRRLLLQPTAKWSQVGFRFRGLPETIDNVDFEKFAAAFDRTGLRLLR